MRIKRSEDPAACISVRLPDDGVPRACSDLTSLAKILSLILILFSSAVLSQDSAAQIRAQAERVHYGDLVDVDVIGSLEFDWRGGLTPEGFIDGAERLNGPLFALCKTEAELAESFRERYRAILRDPNVVVRIVDRSNRALAYVDGAVRNPQRLQLRRALALNELIVLSGGITDVANGEISVFRPPNVNCRPDGETAFENAATQSPRRFNVKIADLLGGKPDANLQVLPGDIVTVVEAGPVFVAGDIRTPRRLNITPGMTLSRAIAASGGAVRPFSGQRARIYRRGVPEVMAFDLRKIADGSQPDPKLEPYDVVEVEQKGVESKRLASLDASGERAPDRLSKLPLRIVD